MSARTAAGVAAQAELDQAEAAFAAYDAMLDALRPWKRADDDTVRDMLTRARIEAGQDEHDRIRALIDVAVPGGYVAVPREVAR